MLTIVDILALTVSASVFVLSARNWRGAMWVAAILASYFITGAWWRIVKVDGEAFTFLCDAALFVAIYLVGRKWWEVALLAFQFLMVMTSLTYFIVGANVMPHDTYSITLELINLAEYLLIGTIGGFSLAGRTDGFAFYNARHIWGFGFAARGQGDAGDP